ncbi:DUF87 domain-containing protein [Candidatus Saccharibacteria bacterium]|nr:DUF87 domain-containing protein [Candidatus Saccharibacteria bacterium]
MIFNTNKRIHEVDDILLLLEIPRTNDKKELAAEQMLASLHGILKNKKELKADGGMQDHISLEIAAINQRIRFYIWAPRHLQAFVEGQIYAQYPSVQIIEQTEDYSKRNLDHDVILTSELILTDNETIPIKTFPSFEVDPLAAITATLAKLDEPGEEAWIQIVARPISDDWHKRGSKMIKQIEGGSGFGGNVGTYVGQLFEALAKPPEAIEKSAPELSERDKTRIRSIEEKGTKLGYQVKIRLIYAGPKEHLAKLRMQAIQGAFKQFNTTNLNGFQTKGNTFSREKLIEYQTRYFADSGYILNIEELASLFHLPHTSVETPNIVWASTKTAEPPSNIPVLKPGGERDISLFGVTNFRGTNTVFGSYRFDRSRHLYIIGQTGVGKSGLLQLLTLSDIFYDQGFCIIDPHGDYAEDMISFIPERRINDVVYFNPADFDHPIGFNPLEVTDPSFKTHISSEIVGVLKRMFDSWGPRLEYILRYTLLALLDYPNSTMLDITRMLTEKKFRNDAIGYITDPVVKTFWTVEFASWNDKFAAEAVAPVLNKIGAFVANPMIRNIIGQTNSTFNIREIMDSGKILIVNLSRGLVGEDNAAILGSLMVTKIQLAAMSRADMLLENRRPFYLYVDEFQNFATDSFAVILSEARKYALNLTVANQYVSQMDPAVRDAVFGNVGSMISFRVGADDSAFLAKYFAPQFEPNDIMTLNNRTFVATMTIQGEKSIAFSGSTLKFPPKQNDLTAQIIEHSRQHYTQPKAEVESRISQNMGTSPAYQTATGQNIPKSSSDTQPNTTPPKQKPQADKPQATPLPINPLTAILKANNKPVDVLSTEEDTEDTNDKSQASAIKNPSHTAPDKEKAEQSSAPTPQKRKRTRTRRKKQTNNELNTASTEQAKETKSPTNKAQPKQPSPTPEPKDDKMSQGIEHEIKLR